MKVKVLVAVFFVLVFSATATFAAMKYQCYSYLNGKPHKAVYVTADNNEQAVQMACEKFKKLGIKFEAVQCK